MVQVLPHRASRIRSSGAWLRMPKPAVRFGADGRCLGLETQIGVEMNGTVVELRVVGMLADVTENGHLLALRILPLLVFRHRFVGGRGVSRGALGQGELIA